MSKRVVDSTARILVEKIASVASGLLTGHFDLMIASASWDERCLTVTANAEARFDTAWLVTYEGSPRTLAEIEHEQVLRKYLLEHSGTVLELRIDSSDLTSAWNLIRQSFVDTFDDADGPISLVIDLNSIPRFLSMSLLGFAFRSGMASTFSAIYSHAESYTHASEGDDDHAFSIGHWVPVPIPGVGEVRVTSSRSHLVVSGGFEGAKTRRLVTALEPDRVSLLIADGEASHVEEAMSQNQRLIDNFKLASRHITQVPMNSFRSMVRAIQEVSDIQQDELSPVNDEDTSFLMCGPKLVSFAMCVVALDNPIAQVYYPNPSSHNESHAKTSTSFTFVSVRL